MEFDWFNTEAVNTVSTKSDVRVMMYGLPANTAVVVSGSVTKLPTMIEGCNLVTVLLV